MQAGCGVHAPLRARACLLVCELTSIRTRVRVEAGGRGHWRKCLARQARGCVKDMRDGDHFQNGTPLHAACVPQPMLSHP